MRLVKPSGDAERATQTTLDTVELTKKTIAAWKSPPFQRDLKTTPKVLALAAEISKTCVLPGVITLGVLDGTVYVVDGQHRLHGFLMSDATAVYADVRTHYFKTMAEMADEFVLLNSSLVRLKPDDILRGLEQSNVHLQRIRKKCPFVGYDMIRRNTSAPVLSMSSALKTWLGSRNEVPSFPSMGGAAGSAAAMDEAETGHLIDFLTICYSAWQRDPEHGSLWSSLNMILCMWLYRRVVIGDAGKGTSRSKKLDAEQFRRCLMSLAADSTYMEYLVGRRISDRDRPPTYNRMKAIFARRYAADKNDKLLLPGPAWAHGSSK